MEKLGIDIKLLLAQLINFILFFIIFSRFIAKPFSNFLKDEKFKEEDKQRILDELKKQEEEILIKQKNNEQKLQQEFDKAIKKAQEEGNIIKRQIIAEAKKDAEESVAKSRKQIAQEKLEMYEEVKKKIVDLSIFMIENGLKEYLTIDTQKEIVKKILTNLTK